MMLSNRVIVTASSPAAIDVEGRRVAGAVVPWGVAAMVEGCPFPLTFVRGSLAIDERARLLRNHDRHDAIGIPEWWADDPRVMRAGFRLGRTAAADEALALADDGIVTGLSLGAELLDLIEGNGGVIARAALVHEVSLVAIPAWADARLGA
jgi:HK97 family phage prohead protease